MKIVQCGMPRSGNSWVYRIIREIHREGGVERSSYIQNRPVFRDAKTWNLGFSEQAKIDTVEVTDERVYAVIGTQYRERVELDEYLQPGRHVWTHSPWCERSFEFLSKFDKAVYIMRDGRDVAISMSHYVFKPNVLRYDRGMWERNSEEFLRHRLPGMLLTWVSHVGGHLERLGELDLRVVVYERLREEFDAEVRALADYLEVELSPAAIARIKNAVEFDKLQNADPGHLRSGVTGEWVDSLSEEEKSIARRIAGPMLQILGYPVHAGDASRPEAPDASMSRELRRAVELSSGTVWDKVHYAASLLRSSRPVGEKIRKGLAFLRRT